MITIIPPGTETNAQYHASGAWGSTLISIFLSSPRLANAIRTGIYKLPETPSMRFGSYFHALMENECNFNMIHRCAPTSDRRTKEWKAAEAEATSNGIKLIPKDDWDDLHNMAESVRANPLAASLLDGAEQEVGFRMDNGPIKIQCRADLIHRWDHMGDLKTTTDLDEFSHSIANFGYYRQAALYRRIVYEACGKWLPFSFISVERKEPHFRCRVFDLTKEYLSLGMSEVETALKQIVDRTLRNNWEDGNYAESVEPPGYLLNKVMNRLAA